LGNWVYALYHRNDLERIRNCTIFHRSIHLDFDTNQTQWRDETTGLNDTVLDFGEITQIRGDLVLTHERLSFEVVRATKLKQIHGGFLLKWFPNLNEVDMPSLDSIGGVAASGGHTLWFSGLPELRRVQFGPEGASVSYESEREVANQAFITRTGLQKVDFLKSEKQAADDDTAYLSGLTLDGNSRLTEINLPELAGRVGNLVLMDNNANLTVTLARVKRLYNATIENGRELHFPTLEIVDQDLEITSTALENINFEKLYRVGRLLSITNNSLLDTLDLSNLTLLGYIALDDWPYGGDIWIDGNPRLRHINLTAAEKMNGIVRINGSFDRYELFF
jgi:hypothetical protein